MNTHHNCKGFSLVELMVALVISVILLGGITQIFMSSKKSFTIQDSLGRQQENGRYAVDTLAQDLRRTGYWGGNADVSAVTGTEAPVTPAATCNTGDNTWARMIDRRVFGLNQDENAALGAYACINDGNGYTRGDVLVVRFAAPWLVGGITTPSIENNDRLYVRSSLTLSEIAGRMFMGKDEADVANDMDPALPASPSERESELIARAYYIGPSGQTCNGVAVPSLFREGLDDNGRPVAEEIAFGIDNFQVRFGVDTDGDNSVDQYLDAGSADLDELDEWNQVIAVRFWLLTRGECPETGFDNTLSFAMGDVNYTPATDADGDGNDDFRRQLYQTTVRLRNIN